jgi:proline iminopeptidase
MALIIGGLWPEMQEDWRIRQEAIGYVVVMRAQPVVAAAAALALAAGARVLARSTIFEPAAAVENTVPRSSGVLTIGGTPHLYLTEGTGLTCIVVGLAPSYPPLYSDQLKRRIRFVYVDFKNSWNAESAGGVEKMTMDALVDEVDQVRSGLRLERACVVGHSAPGLVAVEYTLRHPDRVSHMILVSVEPYFTPEWLKARAKFWETDASAERKAAYSRNVERFPDELLQKLSPRDAFALRYVRNGPRYFYDPSYDLYWAFAGKHFSAELITYFINTIVANYDPRPRLTRNTVPAFVALGRYDYNIPYREWDGARKTTPHLASQIFERSGHFPMLEESERFDESVIRWLDAPR